MAKKKQDNDNIEFIVLDKWNDAQKYILNLFQNKTNTDLLNDVLAQELKTIKQKIIDDENLKDILNNYFDEYYLIDEKNDKVIDLQEDNKTPIYISYEVLRQDIIDALINNKPTYDFAFSLYLQKCVQETKASSKQNINTQTSSLQEPIKEAKTIRI